MSISGRGGGAVGLRPVLAAVAVALGAATACTPGSAHNDIAARNLCATIVRVEEAALPELLGRHHTDVPPGETVYLSTAGRRSTVYVRLGAPMADPEATLDPSIPHLVYEWDELIVATPEEGEDGYETYFIVEGELCP
ncbi:MAG: hypothetical protein AAF962_06115 [Actinomycetota bacterium]